jgi:hypothetical protein
MKTYKSAKDVKKALLQGKEVVINKWSALINAKDEVEICFSDALRQSLSRFCQTCAGYSRDYAKACYISGNTFWEWSARS